MIILIGLHADGADSFIISRERLLLTTHNTFINTHPPIDYARESKGL